MTLNTSARPCVNFHHKFWVNVSFWFHFIGFSCLALSKVHCVGQKMYHPTLFRARVVGITLRCVALRFPGFVCHQFIARHQRWHQHIPPYDCGKNNAFTGSLLHKCSLCLCNTMTRVTKCTTLATIVSAPWHWKQHGSPATHMPPKTSPLISRKLFMSHI